MSDGREHWQQVITGIAHLLIVLTLFLRILHVCLYNKNYIQIDFTYVMSLMYSLCCTNLHLQSIVFEGHKKQGLKKQPNHIKPRNVTNAPTFPPFFTKVKKFGRTNERTHRRTNRGKFKRPNLCLRHENTPQIIRIVLS